MVAAKDAGAEMVVLVVEFHSAKAVQMANKVNLLGEIMRGQINKERLQTANLLLVPGHAIKIQMDDKRFCDEFPMSGRI